MTALRMLAYATGSTGAILEDISQREHGIALAFWIITIGLVAAYVIVVSARRNLRR